MPMVCAMVTRGPSDAIKLNISCSDVAEASAIPPVFDWAHKNRRVGRAPSDGRQCRPPNALPPSATWRSGLVQPFLAR